MNLQIDVMFIFILLTVGLKKKKSKKMPKFLFTNRNLEIQKRRF